MSANKPGTIVVDDLPSQCTTLQLLAAFRRYGKILRAWRSHGDQGLVTFANMMDALDAVSNEDGRRVNEKTLRVTAAFFNSSEPTRKGWWQCALCRSWNEQSQANSVCQGYMCGLKQHDEGIEAYENQLMACDEYFQQPEQAAPEMVPDMHQQLPQQPLMPQQQQQPPQQQPPQQQQQPQSQSQAQQHPQQPPYYPYTDYQQQQPPQTQAPAQPYEGPVQEDPMHSNMVTSNYIKQPYAYSTGYDMQMPAPYPSSYPPTVTPRSQRGYMNAEPSSEVPVSPPPSSLNSHCVLVSNVPTNITDKTLNKVFMKFATHNNAKGWVKPTQQDTPRILAEGQVLFDTPDCARRAVEGESGRDVDGQSIWCTYSEELFILSVVAEEHEAWNSMLCDEQHYNSFMNDLGPYFNQYGITNAILRHERVVFVEYYSLASALDAICGEDGETRQNFKLQVAFARGGTRWPCMQCMKVNSPKLTTCEGCAAPRAPINARLLKENISKSVTSSGFTYGDSYKGYCHGLTGYQGSKLSSHDDAPQHPPKVNRAMEEQNMGNGHPQHGWKGGHRQAPSWGNKGGRGGASNGFQRQPFNRNDAYNMYSNNRNNYSGNGNRMAPQQGGASQNGYRNDGRK
eukprot:TRINITY_DN2855_c0_g2_i1.p1 TRINITY_DN2855_c0_g2~~TRINITY_DN2855_c0_g2_i1.p1  ORF type:complete len:624 (+),score=177.98 TRINITY_DN2855_c0_g2_i1:93-1964(+)